jgi:serine/threonine protein kinase
LLANELVKRLEYLHSKGYVHHDIKPDNIMLGTDNSTVYLIDFGYSLNYINNGIHVDMIREKRFVGNLMYCSLNQVKAKPVTRRDDLESLFYLLASLNMPRGLPWKHDINLDKVRSYF